MRVDVGLPEAVDDFIPLPHDFRDLFLGEPGESVEQSAARTTVAREVLAELLAEESADEVAWVNAQYAVQLTCLAQHVRASSPRSRYGEVSGIRVVRVA